MIATSVELFEARIPNSIKRRLHGKRFDIRGADHPAEKILLNSQFPENAKGEVWLGSGVVSILLDRFKDRIRSPESFVDALKVSVMSSRAACY